jgi:hypothetical protein
MGPLNPRGGAGRPHGLRIAFSGRLINGQTEPPCGAGRRA